MSTKNLNDNSKKQKIEERISFFMNNIRSSKSKNINKTNYTYETQENNRNTNEKYPKTEQNLKNSILFDFIFLWLRIFDTNNFS